MYNLKRKSDENLYIQMMNNMKKLNSEWIELRQSNQYKIGMIFIDTFSNIKHLKLKRLLNEWINWIRNHNISFSKKSKTDINNKSNYPNYFSNERIAIYTVIFGKYDEILEPSIKPSNCDFYIITDQDFDDSNSIWKVKKIKDDLNGYSNIEKNRFYKMHPEKIFKDYKYSIYVDGNIQIITDLTEYVNMLNQYGIGTHIHNSRDCVYEEIKTVKKLKKDTVANLQRHEKYLLETKMPKHYGLLQCNFIVREHNNPLCIKIMNEWWNEFIKYSKRDQISLPHILFMNKIPISKIGILGRNIYINPSFRILNHKDKR